MNVILENLTDKPLWSQLNSGASVHVGPRSLSASLPGNEVTGNPKLARLANEHVIRVLESPGEVSDPGEPGKKPKEPAAVRETEKHRK